jgi:hypothetical protein
MKTIALVAAMVALAGCAPIDWVRPGTSPQQTTQDAAGCRLLARGMTPGGFYAQGTPAFVAGAAIADAIGTAAVTYANNVDCMKAKGYLPAAPAPAQTAEAPQALAAAAPPAAPGSPPPSIMRVAGPRACRPDTLRLCSTVIPGHDRLEGCLRQHASEIAAPCAARLAELAAEGR